MAKSKVTTRKARSLEDSSDAKAIEGLLTLGKRISDILDDVAPAGEQLRDTILSQEETLNALTDELAATKKASEETISKISLESGRLLGLAEKSKSEAIQKHREAYENDLEKAQLEAKRDIETLRERMQAELDTARAACAEMKAKYETSQEKLRKVKEELT